MKLHRIALVTFNSPPKVYPDFSLNLHGVELQATQVIEEDNQKYMMLLVGTIEASNILTFTDNGVEISEEHRCKCEFAIESLANLIALTSRDGRRISSPELCLAISGLSEEEEEILSTNNMTRYTLPFAVSPTSLIDLEALISSEKMSDRLEGVSLLIEAYSTPHSVGKFREFMRFFELAFALPTSKLAKPVYTFLENTRFGYTENEIENWFNKRNGAMHGDKKFTKQLVYESDVRVFLMRIEQAAFDVLMNKKLWHFTETERREFYKHESGTSSYQTNSTFMTRGKQTSLGIQFDDPFGSYPYFPDACISSVPEGWWVLKLDNNNQTGYMIFEKI